MANSTGFLVVLGRAHLTPAEEAGWYGCCGLLLGRAALVAVGYLFRSCPLLSAVHRSAAVRERTSGHA